MTADGLTESMVYDLFVVMTFQKEETLNKVVARLSDGRTIKGMTADFFPNKENFHIRLAKAPSGAEPVEISTKVSTFAAMAARAACNVPKTLLRMPSNKLCSTNGTCL